MKNVLLYFGLCCLVVVASHAQDLTTRTEACPGEIIPFNTPLPAPTGTTYYDWDFCPNDLLQTPQASLVTTFINDLATPNPDAHRPEGFDIVFDGTKWVGLLASGSNNNILRIDFPEGIEGVPTYTNLGNPNNALFVPRTAKIFKHNNKWFAFVACATSLPTDPRLTLLDFGNSLLNSPTGTSFLIPTMGIAPQGVDVIFENGRCYVVLPSVTSAAPQRKLLTVLDFGTDLNQPAFTELYTFNTNINGSEKKITHIRSENNNLHIFMAGSVDSVNGVVRFDFGSSITNMPTATSLGSYVSGKEIGSVEVMRDGTNYLLLALSFTGELFRLNFGSSYLNVPTVTNLGNFGLLGQQQQSNRPSTYSTLLRKDSKCYLFGLNRMLGLGDNNQLVRLTFPNLCNGIPSVAYTQNAETSYFESGIQSQNLMLYDSNGYLLYTHQDNLLIKQAMIGNFTSDGQCFGQPTNFNNLSRGLESNVLSWEWNFGDGQTSGIREATHTYALPGKYTVSLTVNNNTGCTNSVEKEIRISSRPIVDFRVKSIDCATNAVVFEDLSDLTDFDMALGGEIRSRTWFFGDGTRWIASPYTATTYTKIYDTADVFTVTLVVTDETGCSSATSKKISILPTAKPIADFEYSTPCLEVPIKFTDKSSLPVGSIGELTGWQWTFYAPDGVSVLATSNLKEPIYAFSSMGTYKVKLSVRNSLGCTSEKISDIAILPSPNTLFQVSVLTGPAPLTVKFTNATTGAVGYLWNFGTGEYSTLASPTYTFQNQGVYTVTFQAKNALGCGKIVTQTIIVEQPTAEEPPLPPSYAFKIYPNPTLHDLFVEFEGSPTEASYHFTDLTGKTVLQGDLKERKNTISMKRLPAGVYILHLREGNRFWTRKIVRI